MGTTSLVVEFVIIGFQVATWVILVVLSIFGYKWIDIGVLSSWAGLIGILLLGASYSLGLIFDAVFMTATKALSIATYKWPAEATTRLARERGIPFDHEIPVMMRTYIVAKSPALGDHVSRMTYGFRLLMSTTVNILLICIGTLVFLATRTEVSRGWLAIVLAVFLVLAGLSAYAWYHEYRIYYLELALIYQALRAPRAGLHKLVRNRGSRLRKK